MDYLALVNDNQRDDLYVNATKWCQAFGKRFNNWRRSKGTDELLQALASRFDSDVSQLLEDRRSKGTWFQRVNNRSQSQL